MKSAVGQGVMLNAYPDSMGGRLSDMVELLRQEEWDGAVQDLYLLPSLYHSDLDRGFSVIDYDLNEELASAEDLQALRALGIGLKLDFVLNHASVQSPQFQDLLEHGEKSRYRDFFLDWNAFWEGCGERTEEGYILPGEEYLSNMFFRKPGLPLLLVPFPDGSRVPYWNTFYQEEVRDGQGRVTGYRGQMDLNIRSPLVREFYRDTLKKLAGYGAGIVRLDAFAYAHKEAGAKNFLNEPGTWELLADIRALADRYGFELLPEIHASYEEKVYEKLAQKGYLVYDFFLPGLLIEALEKKSGRHIKRWAQEIAEKKIRTVNMLGSHDGIPLLDLQGLLTEEEIGELTELLVSRGGYVKNLHGQKGMYYQVNAAYFSALGEDEKKLLLARAIQMFLPGKPQVWYLDLFAGTNDYTAVQAAGEGGHKEINRTNLTREQMEERLKLPVVQKQLALLRFRNSCEAFGWDAGFSMEAEGSRIVIRRFRNGVSATLFADLCDCSYRISTESCPMEERML